MPKRDEENKKRPSTERPRRFSSIQRMHGGGVVRRKIPVQRKKSVEKPFEFPKLRRVGGNLPKAEQRTSAKTNLQAIPEEEVASSDVEEDSDLTRQYYSADEAGPSGIQNPPGRTSVERHTQRTSKVVPERGHRFSFLKRTFERGKKESIQGFKGHTSKRSAVRATDQEELLEHMDSSDYEDMEAESADESFEENQPHTSEDESIEEDRSHIKKSGTKLVSEHSLKGRGIEKSSGALKTSMVTRRSTSGKPTEDEAKRSLVEEKAKASRISSPGPQRHHTTSKSLQQELQSTEEDADMTGQSMTSNQQSHRSVEETDHEISSSEEDIAELKRTSNPFLVNVPTQKRINSKHEEEPKTRKTSLTPQHPRPISAQLEVVDEVKRKGSAGESPAHKRLTEAEASIYLSASSQQSNALQGQFGKNASKPALIAQSHNHDRTSRQRPASQKPVPVDKLIPQTPVRASAPLTLPAKSNPSRTFSSVGAGGHFHRQDRPTLLSLDSESARSSAVPSLGGVSHFHMKNVSGVTAIRSFGSRKSRKSAFDDARDARVTGSGHLRLLADNEREFHRLVAEGDVAAVREFLALNPTFDINCVNHQKISALHVAIREKKEEMVVLLLDQKGIQVCDIVLFTIKTGDLRMLAFVLKCLESSHPGLEFAPCPDSVEFADDVTPLMLAAREGQFEMVDLLLERGHRMPDMHHPFCTCSECLAQLRKVDRLKYSTMKMNMYRAISNPAYLFRTAHDPIRRAFELTVELQAAARMFPQFYAEYDEMRVELRKLSADLIGCCRDAEEVELILKQPGGCTSAKKLIFPRLQLAIDLMQKEFVAHPFTQAVLEDAWIGKNADWNVLTPVQQTLAILPRLVLLPWITVTACCLPNSKQLERWDSPVNKLISSFASYVLFLLALFFQCSQDKKEQKRGPPNTGWEAIIGLFVMGFTWSSIRLCFTLGPKRFFSLLWNWFDCAMEALFLLTFVFWIAAAVDVGVHGDAELPRMFWNPYDPTLISEGLLTIATIMAFCRLYLPMSLNYYLGPLQISIGKMTLDLFRFVFVYTLLILAFTAALCHFYQPYEGMVQFDSSSNTNTSQVASFVNFPSTLKTFFWAIFGMSPIESADVIIANLPEEGKTNSHNFTEGVGYFAFAVFQFIAVIVILNMLVACMANTFTKVIDNVAVEWVFGRTKIYLVYMYQSVLPPPLNLLPTLSTLNNIVTWLSLLGRADKKRRARCSFVHCCYIEHEVEERVDKDFPALMAQLVHRYLRAKDGANDADSTESKRYSHQAEISQLKELVKDLHYQVGSTSSRNEI